MWNNLTPRELSRKADRVLQFARSMPGDVRDTFHAAEQLDDLLGGADPTAMDKAIDEARQGIRDGAISLNTAVERLMNAYCKSATNGNAARRLASAFRMCLAGHKSLADAFAQLTDEESDLPTAEEIEVMRMQRDSAAIHYRRTHGTTQPEPFRYSRDEINLGGALAAKRGITFDAAVQLLRSGR